MTAARRDRAAKGPVKVGLFLVVGVLASAGAAAARAEADNMVGSFAENCAATSDPRVAAAGPGRFGAISAAQVRTGLFKDYPVNRDLLSEAGGRALATRVTALKRGRTPAPPIPSGDQPLLERMWTQVEQWGQPGLDHPGDLRSIAGGGLMIVDREGRPTSDQAGAVFADILGGSSETFLFICKLPEQAATPDVDTSSNDGNGAAAQAQGPDFVLVKTKEGLSETSLADKEFGEFSYSDNRQARAQSYGFEFTAGLRFQEYRHTFTGPLNGISFSANATPYVSYNRQGSNDPAADGYVNNLNLGFQVAGDLEIRRGSTWRGYYAVSYEHETDDDFAADADSLELRIDPPLPSRFPGHRMFTALTSEADPLDLWAKWTVEGVADWVEVDDPGEKEELTARSTFRRLGYDLGLDFRFGPAATEWRVLWTNLYQVREGQTPDGGDAEHFSAALLFELSRATHYSLGVSYDRGEDLQSLERSEVWKLVAGLRF